MDKIVTNDLNSAWLGQHKKDIYLNCVKKDEIKLDYEPDIVLFGKNNFMVFESFVLRKTMTFLNDIEISNVKHDFK